MTFALQEVRLKRRGETQQNTPSRNLKEVGRTTWMGFRLLRGFVFFEVDVGRTPTALRL